ncbi:MAG: hypothetical protein H6R27_496 [Proteobacteria bacterium]|nr:hypothetical protein [Pseudomonadota bacterium]
MSNPASRAHAAILLVTLATLAACGGGDKPAEREVMKPEETVVGDLVTAPERVEDRTNAAMEAHRDALQEQISESEGGSPDEEE